MKTELEKSLDLLKPSSNAPHAILAAHSEVRTALERLEAENDACREAVVHLLNRIRMSRELAYHCGLGTEALKLLVRAAAVITEQKEAEVEGFLFEDKQ